MSSSPRARSPRRSSRTLHLLLAIALLASAASRSHAIDTEREATGSVEGVWITLGTDAYETLAAVADLRFQLEPLSNIDEASGVVLTRVHEQDLARVSNELHRDHRRCAGFMAHTSRADAERELSRLRQPSAQPLGGSYTIDQPAAVQRLEAALDKPSILSTIDALSNDFFNRFHAHADGTAAANWLRDQWAGFAAGRPYASAELFSHGSTLQPSVILTLEGATLPDEVVVLGAHLDSIAFPGSPSDPEYRAPGADDDASGVAVLTEVARVALADGFRPERTIQFMAYAAEEVGLVGSGDIASTYQTDGIDVVAVLQLDMTAFMGSALDVGILSEQWTDPTLTGFISDLLDAYQPDLNWSTTSCGYACSDHASWDSAGYPAAMAFEALFGQHNSALHTTSDTVGTIGNNADHAHKFARLATAFMAEVAKEADLDIFEDGFESGTTSAWTVVVP